MDSKNNTEMYKRESNPKESQNTGPRDEEDRKRVLFAKMSDNAELLRCKRQMLQISNTSMMIRRQIERVYLNLLIKIRIWKLID